MPRFFALHGRQENHARLNDEEMHHAKHVMRLKEGEEIALILDGKLYKSAFSSAEEMPLLSLLPSPEPDLRVTLYQGIPKGDKMDYITQKCVEGGVFKIVPVAMSRCVSKWEKGKDEDKKVSRLQRIALEAAKQSGRAILPEIEKPLSFKQLLNKIPDHEKVFIPWEDAPHGGLKTIFEKENHFPKDIALIIGPEGGMSKEEVDEMKNQGALPVTLGKRIFRTETAGLAALIALMALSGNME